MSVQRFSETFTGTVATIATQRITGKLLATQGYVVGIEIGSSGTRPAVALADLEGHILHHVRRPVESGSDAATVLATLQEMLAEVTTPERLLNGRILRVGVAVGGLVDATGVVRMLYHAHGWDNFPLQDYFSDLLDIPCIIDNNANAAALAEVQRGVGGGERIVLYVGLGRGISGALVVNGRVYHGAACAAGEIGHILVQEEGPRCTCGIPGHLEAVASAQAIVGAMLDQAQEDLTTQAAIRRVVGGRAGQITPAQIFQLAAEGDQVAQRIVKQVQHYLGIALANIVHLVNPGMIILGGSVAQAGDLLLVPLRERIEKFCLPVASQSLHIVQGSLGTEANLMGAVTLALQDL